jgi:hypothetical protein
MVQKKIGPFLNYLLELNIALLIFAFSLIHMVGWFNDLWKSLLIIWVLTKLTGTEKIKISIPTSFNYLFSLITVIILSCFFSGNIKLSFDNISYFVLGIGLCVVIYDFFSHDEKRISRVITYFIISTLLTSTDAIIHQLVFAKGGFGVSLSGLRATGFFSNPFQMSLWSGIGLFLAIFRLIESSTKTSKLIYLACVIILEAAFLLSKTRAPWIAMAITFFIALFYTPYKKDILKVILILGVIIFIVLVFDNSMRMRVVSVISEGDARWIIFENCLRMIRENFTLMDWFLGRGPGLFKLEYAQLDLAKLHRVFTFPHMILLELFYASGLLGVLTFLLWLVHYLFNLLYLLKENTISSCVQHVGLMPILILLICFFNVPFFSRYFSFPFWFFTGASFYLFYRVETNNQKA